MLYLLPAQLAEQVARIYSRRLDRSRPLWELYLIHGLPDGRVAFLDFGLFKVMPKELIELELACQRAGHEGDGERLHEIWSETGFLAHPERFRPDKLLAQFRDVRPPEEAVGSAVKRAGQAG